MRPPRIIWVLLVASATALADDQPPAEAKSGRSSAEEDAIAIAKREFDAVKSARNASELAKLGLPQFQTPDFQPTTMSAPTLQSLKDKSAAAMKKKNTNWLVDAMADAEKEKAKKNPDPDARRKLKDEGDPDTERDPLAAPSTEGKATKTESAEKKPSEPVSNPLDRYMASWMTPQDLSLLRPTGNSGASPNASRFDSPAGDLSASVPANLSVDALGLLSSGSVAPAVSASPRENPFLQSLAAPQSLAGLAAPNAAQVNASPPPMQFAPPPAPVVPRSVKPDFVKPRDEDKYYKPMKKF